MLEKEEELSKLEKLQNALHHQISHEKKNNNYENPIENILIKLDEIKVNYSEEFINSKKIISDIYSIQNRNKSHIEKINKLLIKNSKNKV